MSCSVAVTNSSVFSPSSSLFCNKTSIISPSPDTLTLTHVKFSPSSLFRFRLQKQPTGLSSSSSSSTSSSSSSSAAALAPAAGSPQTILKRKRPAKLDIPVASISFGGTLTTPREVRRDEVEEEHEGCYSVYCKRGRREAMEDHYSVVLDLQGDSKQHEHEVCYTPTEA